MAGNEDALRTLMGRQVNTRRLSMSRRNVKPEKEEFGLQDCNLNQLYKEYKKFEKEKQQQIDDLKKSVPEPDKNVFGKSGITTLVMLVIFVAYMMLVPSHNLYVFGALALLLLGSFLVYFGGKNRRNKLYKKELEEMKQRQRALEKQDFYEEETYEALLEYAKAMYDYETWQKRDKLSYWKALTKKAFVPELVSLLNMAGFEADMSYEASLDIVAEDEEQERTAYTVSVDKLPTKELITEMQESMREESASKGYLIVSQPPGDDLKRMCTRGKIEIWQAEDVFEIQKSLS